MNSLISRQSAIDIVAPYDDEREMRDALEDLPPAQPDVPDSNVVDLISREAISYALNTIKVSKNETWYSFYQKVLNELCKLPSAQPERRIKCAHCKRYDLHNHRCKWWNHGVSNVDWCSYAERKEGEADERSM